MLLLDELEFTNKVNVVVKARWLIGTLPLSYQPSFTGPNLVTGLRSLAQPIGSGARAGPASRERHPCRLPRAPREAAAGAADPPAYGPAAEARERQLCHCRILPGGARSRVSPPLPRGPLFLRGPGRAVVGVTQQFTLETQPREVLQYYTLLKHPKWRPLLTRSSSLWSCSDPGVMTQPYLHQNAKTGVTIGRLGNSSRKLQP
ncbi:uncharacterized protein [Manis javanica]|uniref:uncharacterized protein n=1 Tax=Manis javanica TaxID=9974 RepID=UPI003C6DAD1D